MGFMAEFNNAYAARFVYQGRLRNGNFYMTFFTLIGGKRFFPVVTSPAGIALVDLSHRDFFLPFYQRKEFCMAFIAFEFACMRVVDKFYG